MRIAVLSDVHSNLQALQAVLVDLAGQYISQIYVLGDVIGYGANPRECLEILLNEPRVKIFLRGNHENLAYDYCYCKPGEVNNIVNPFAWAAIQYSCAQLLPEQVNLFKDWPEMVENWDDDFTVVHGAFSGDHSWDYIWDRAIAAKEAEKIQTSLCFHGHTHLAALYDWNSSEYFRNSDFNVQLQPGRKYVINVGSVGQPRDKNPAAAYGVLDVSNAGVKTYYSRRVKYDVDSAMKAIREAGLPERLSTRLKRGT